MSVLQRGRVVYLQDRSALSQPGVVGNQVKSQGRVVGEAIAAAAERAERILAEAESVARARLAQVEQEIAGMRADLEISAKAKAEEQFVGKCLELATLRQRFLEQSQRDVIAVASLLAEQILVEQLTIQPQRVAELAQKALREAGGARAITLHLAPQYANLLTDELETFGPDVGAQIRIAVNHALGPGDLLIETDVGYIDARISTQISHLAFLIVESMSK